LPSFVFLLGALIAGLAFLPRLSRGVREFWNRLSDYHTTASLNVANLSPDSANEPEFAVRLVEHRLPRGVWARFRVFLRFYTSFVVKLISSRPPRRNWLSIVREMIMTEFFEAKTTWRAEQRDMRPYLSSSGEEQDAVALELRRLIDGLAPNGCALGLDRELPGSNLPWEDAIARLLVEKENAPPINFAPFRTGAVLAKEFPGRWRAHEKEPLRTLMAGSWERSIRQAWANGAQRSFARKLTGFFFANSPAPAEGLPNFRICHLLGETLRRRDGVRFRASPLAVGSVAETVESQSDPEDTVRSGEQLLLEENGLFILQEIPETSGDRLQTDREKTADMRRFADELFQGGAWAVLLIPNLPSALALQIVERLGHGLGFRRAPSWSELLQLTGTIRREIAKASAHGTPEFLSELAWEVTLFARSGAHACLAAELKSKTPADGSPPA
jgi:hypothetical protein